MSTESAIPERRPTAAGYVPDEVVDADTFLLRADHLLEVLLERLRGRDDAEASDTVRDAAIVATVLFLIHDARDKLGGT